MIGVTAGQTLTDIHATTLDVQMQFSLPGGLWHGRERTLTQSFVANTSAILNLENGGNTLNRGPVLAFTFSSSATEVFIGGFGLHLLWRGTIISNDVMIWDCEAQTVTLNRDAAYSGFGYGSTHRQPGWLPA